jgi:ABC-2 type transport system permease protein
MTSLASTAAPRVSVPTAGSSPFTGTSAMVRLALRRDRVLIPVWLAVFVGMAAGSAATTVGLYPDLPSRHEFAASVNNTPTLVALYGRIYDESSLGEISLLKLGGMGCALVAVLTIILMVRHTRAEEEAGRLELLGGTVLGRYAALTAALIVTSGTSLMLGLLTALGLVGVGLPVGGSLTFGAAWACAGLSFAAVAAICAQLSTGARTATATASAVLGLTYLLRAIGDTASSGGPTWALWLSPVGWSQQARAFSGDRWGVLSISVVFSAIATAVSFALVSHRDLGAGVVADRPGRSSARGWLGSPLGLAFRLQRGLLLGWTACFLILGPVLGNISSNIGSMISSPQARDFIAKLGGQQVMVDAFLATEMSFLGVFGAVYGVQAAMRLRTEETALRAEPLLATAVGRRQWLASHVIVAAAGTCWLLFVGGLSAGLALAAQDGDGAQVGRLLGAALAQAPGALVLVGLVVAAFGVVPRWVQVGWAALVGSLLLGEFGPLFSLDQRVMDISPFAHSPRLPGPSADLTPLIWLTLIAIALTILGTEAFRRRDID